MPRSAEIAAQLPFMRRYARALTGSQHDGDALVERALAAIVANQQMLDGAKSIRIPLFTAVHEALDGAAPSGEQAMASRLIGLPLHQRKLLLLTALENFPIADAAAIMGMDCDLAQAELDAAYGWLDRELHCSVLIIEDEPLIAMDLEHLVQDLGHRVTALAATRSEAVAAVARERPGLVLADIQLADGSSGIDAVNDIQAAMDVPVIFITAFPERLLTGEPMEPAFLITKPFRPAAVRATIAQALMFEASPA